MIGFIFPLIFVSIIIIVVVSISINKNKELKQFLKSFDLKTLKKIDVKIMQTSTSKAKVIGGSYIGANLYLNKDFIIITQKTNTYFNSIYNIRLPIVITSDMGKASNIMYSPKIIIPNKIKITGWNSINIEYEEQKLLNVKYNLTIRLENKKEIEYFKELKIENWC